jgi:predicted AlkP superfamily phosphohydrolase/phosphomutase
MKRKLLVVGLDGATLDLIKPWADEGKLPLFSRLMDEGSWGPLRSVLQPYTAQAWSSFLTGKNAGKHGIFDFLVRDFQTYGFRLVNAASRSGDSIWRILSSAGKRVIIVNVPMTYPPEEVNGILISGRDTPGTDVDYTFPKELKKELEAALGGYLIVPNDWLYMRRGRPDKARDELLREIDIHFASTNYLLSRYPWDFCIFVITATDGVAHFFWRYHDPEHPLYEPDDAAKYGETILEVYRRIDNELEALIRDLDEEVTLVMLSDHGSGPLHNRAIHLNLWLEREGFLTFREKGGPSVPARLFRTAKGLFYSFLPFEKLAKVRALFPDRLRSRLLSQTVFYDLDWSKTKAYSEEFRGHIWINLKGRDPQGSVEPGTEYEQTRESIISRLSELRDPQTGGRLLEGVHRREDLYKGPFLEGLPDLIVEAKGTPAIFHPSPKDRSGGAVRILSKREMRQLKTSGGHLMDGLFLVRGQGIRPGCRVEGARLIDLAPTLLYLMGEPIPEDMDGQVLSQIFASSFLEAHPIRTAKSASETASLGDERRYNEEEERRIKEQLKGLGYLGD